MTTDDAIAIHDAINRDEPYTYINAANMVTLPYGHEVQAINEAVAVLQTLRHRLLDTERYTEAALLSWGTRLFDPRPRAVQKLWSALSTKDKVLVMGSGSQGKSYTGIAWFFLDWERDPEYTAVKLVSTTMGHAKANTWSTMVRFHRESVIPFAGEVQANFIGVTSDDKHASIAMVAIPQGPDSKARLQGFHPRPRVKPHPVFGNMSRVRLFIDEAEDAPPGMWQGVGNMLGNEDFKGSVKVYGATNPKDRSSAFAQRAEPAEGWAAVNVDVESWISGQGWFVLHLDAAKSENVMQKRTVFEGMMTYQGFQNYEKLGRNHADYWTFGRGWYPETIVSYAIIAPYVTDDLRGTYTFQHVIANIATFDAAFEEGGDDAILTTGRYGLAVGFANFRNGEYTSFGDNPRYVIQAEQQFPIAKSETVQMSQEIIALLRELKVPAEWFAMDKTGNAKGLHDVIRSRYGDILGIQWGEGATDQKILEEDTDVASKRYDGLVTEMWFADALWSQYGYIKLAPIISTIPLFSQLTGRRYYRVSKTLVRVESKDEYKSRNSGASPNEADSLIMMPHLVRMRAHFKPAALPENQKPPDIPATAKTEPWLDIGPQRSKVPNPHGVKFVKTR